MTTCQPPQQHQLQSTTTAMQRRHPAVLTPPSISAIQWSTAAKCVWWHIVLVPCDNCRFCGVCAEQ